MENIKRRNFFNNKVWCTILNELSSANILMPLLAEDMWLKFVSMHRRKRPLKKDNSLSEQIDCDTDLPY